MSKLFSPAEVGPYKLSHRVVMACPTLPEREMEVCVAIAKGLSSEAMSIEWGISVNTVLTHRKRAYTRLNITSENELMRLVIGALDCPAS